MFVVIESRAVNVAPEAGEAVDVVFDLVVKSWLIVGIGPVGLSIFIYVPCVKAVISPDIETQAPPSPTLTTLSVVL